MKPLTIQLEETELKRLLFLKSKIILSREDLAETGDIVLTALRRKEFNKNAKSI